MRSLRHLICGCHVAEAPASSLAPTLALVSLWLLVGCGEDVPSADPDAGTDGDADADSDSDSDGDGDADGDVDADGDSDGDSDADAGTGVDAGPEPCDEQGTTRTIICGFCGTQNQICANDGLWHDDGECANPGECEPGTLGNQACGHCGTQERLCSASCTWNDWSACEETENAECNPGTQEGAREGCEPGDIQERLCGDDCRWDVTRECSPECIGDPRDVGTDAEEICVPGGPFVMGGADEYTTDDDPEHEVTLYPYFIERFEVTNERYIACIDAGICSEPDPEWGNPNYREDTDRRFAVFSLLQEQAEEFCTWIGRRLPTEAEWEKAARGPSPDRRSYPWGSDPPTCEQANHSECPEEWEEEIDSHPAGASPFGVERMAGGVDEMTADWFAAAYYADSPAVDPRGPAEGEWPVSKGVGERAPADTYPPITSRYEWDGGGFRCARSVEAR